MQQRPEDRQCSDIAAAHGDDDKSRNLLFSIDIAVLSRFEEFLRYQVRSAIFRKSTYAQDFSAAAFLPVIRPDAMQLPKFPPVTL